MENIDKLLENSIYDQEKGIAYFKGNICFLNTNAIRKGHYHENINDFELSDFKIDREKMIKADIIYFQRYDNETKKVEYKILKSRY